VPAFLSSFPLPAAVDEDSRKENHIEMHSKGMRLVSMCLLMIVLTVFGCATFRLNGCAKLAACGELGAYNCSGDLVCADADGNTLASMPLSRSSNPCRICR
jgi:hypothetical protein